MLNAQTVSAAEKVTIVISEKSPYWQITADIMKPVAKRLGLNLQLIYRDLEKVNYLDALKEAVLQPEKPDWIIWTKRRTYSLKFLELCERHKIKTINIAIPIAENNFKTLGLPQQKFSHWQGQIVYDNQYVGEAIAQSLYNKIQTSRSQQLGEVIPESEPVNLIAMSGKRIGNATPPTVAGLQKVVNANKDLTLLQTVYSNWSGEFAFDIFKKLYQRFPNVNGIWVTNPEITKEILKVLNSEKSSTKPVVASLGWNDAIFDKIESGELAFSYGGNHYNGVWALIVIYDIVNGVTLDKSVSSTLMSAKHSKADKSNVAMMRTVFDKAFWQTMNIEQFSKHLNPKITEYDFSLDKLVSSHQQN